MDPVETEPRSSALSRREVFRAGVAAAAAVAGATLLSSAARPAVAGPPGGKGVNSGSFRVRVGSEVLQFATAVEIEPVRTVVTVTPGRPPTLVLEGFVPTTTIRIEVAADKEPVLAKWYESVKGGNGSDRRAVEVDLLTPNLAAVVRTYRATDCALQAFVPAVAAGKDRTARDVYVVRCAVGGGAFQVEDF